MAEWTKATTASSGCSTYLPDYIGLHYVDGLLLRKGLLEIRHRQRLGVGGTCADA